MKFEWDPLKARQNLDKHGVSFDTAREVFLDPFVLELLDDREDYGEDRFIVIGLTKAVLVVTVAYTEREDAIRIISARRATRREREDYEGQKNQGR